MSDIIGILLKIFLYKLTHENEQFLWIKEEDTSYEWLRSLVTSTPIIQHPDFKHPFLIRTDASHGTDWVPF